MTIRWIVLLALLGWQLTTAQHGTFLGPLADSVTEALEDTNKAQVRMCVHCACWCMTRYTGTGQPDKLNLPLAVFNTQLHTTPPWCERRRREPSTPPLSQTDAQPDFAVCQLNNVLLFNGSIYYVTANPAAVSMPDVNLDWLSSGNLTKNQTDYNRYDLALHTIRLRTISHRPAQGLAQELPQSGHPRTAAPPV